MLNRTFATHDPCRDFPAELLLLLQCSHQQPNARQTDRIREAAGRGIDWTTFLSLAERHRVVPHAFLALSRSARDLVPQASMETLAIGFHANGRKNLLVTGELARVCRAMNEAGVPLMCLKGPALAMQLYGGLECRQFKDLDLFVPAERVVETAGVLNQSGYFESQGAPPLSSLSRSQQRRLMTFQKHVVFRRKDGPGAMVELHWQLADHDMLKISPDRLWNNDHRISFAGTRLHVLPPLEQIIFLAWHGSQHRWKRLSWLFDLSQALDKFTDIDWRLLERTAFQMGVQRYVALGLAMLQRLLGTTGRQGRQPNRCYGTQARTGSRRSLNFAKSSTIPEVGSTVPETAFAQVDVRRPLARSCHAILADEMYYEEKPLASSVWTWQLWPKMPYYPRALFHTLTPELSQMNLPVPLAYLKRLLNLERRARQLLLSKFG